MNRMVLKTAGLATALLSMGRPVSSPNRLRPT